MSRVIIAGGRDFSDTRLLFRWLNKIDGIETVLSGGASGADTIGEQYAEVCDIPIERHLPNWDAFGKSAGPIRNADMAERADTLVAFWDGKSRGTKDMIQRALKLGLEVHVIRYESKEDDHE